MSDWTHFNSQGRARMVDVSEKEETVRTAVAATQIQVNEAIYDAIVHKTIKKGDVLAVAQVAGVMAAKNTSDWIPMCHPIPLTGIDVWFQWDTDEYYALAIKAEVKTKANTGVEMEALTAVDAAALTVYDMCKALDRGMVIGPTRLLEKSGGKSGDYRRAEEETYEKS